ncbi:hypothetical protein [Streptosporangium sp. CA-115845]|uniref:hypothetical protein n=1 Tax=Streptosporangium sp. CA-115845 TaxID=3240071 RepID=UPI003D91F50D
MARMLGRYQAPGCCPGMREGWRRTRRVDGPDCSGGGTDTRWRKRVEQREFARELRPTILLPHPMEDLSDCRHGCNGDCLVSGSDVCTFACHAPASGV